MAKAATAAPTLLMPKATAVWLIENTMLTFKQIGNFVGLTEIEVEALANEDVGRGLVGRDPIENSELTQEEIKRCEADSQANLEIKARNKDIPTVKTRAKGPRYTPVSKRGDKPDAIAYILKHHADITDAQITKLIGTTKPTIAAVRDRTHPNTPNLKPRHPADLGLCSYQEFETVLNKALIAAGKDPEKIKAEEQAAAQAALEESDSQTGDSDAASRSGGFDFSNFMPDMDTGQQSSDDQ